MFQGYNFPDNQKKQQLSKYKLGEINNIEFHQRITGTFSGIVA